MEDFKKAIMRGEFRGDFTRDTFNPEKSYSRVLMQQGRVQVDADWNEQVSIHLHYLRTLVRDLGGEHWGPNKNSGFEIKLIPSSRTDFAISKGHYYVNGILCEADTDTTYRNQPNYFFSDAEKKEEINSGDGLMLVYLDVWERHISYVEDDAIREVALGGPDTASRAKIIWQVKVMPLPRSGRADGNIAVNFKENYDSFLAAIKDVIKPGTGKLQASAKDKSKNDTEACLVSPESRYRGAENQLYRVEIHNGSGIGNQATFKWSRENAAVIFPILERVDTNKSVTLVLEHLGHDNRFSLKPGNWVEIIDDDYILQNRAENLLQITAIDHENMSVTINSVPESDVGKFAGKHPYLRRWDQTTGDENGISVPDSSKAAAPWIDLEDGIQIRFSDAAGYQSGDYWLIPARVITGDVEWPKQDGKPQEILPHGVVHYYAPLAILDKNQPAEDTRCILIPLFL